MNFIEKIGLPTTEIEVISFKKYSTYHGPDTANNCGYTYGQNR